MSSAGPAFSLRSSPSIAVTDRMSQSKPRQLRSRCEKGALSADEPPRSTRTRRSTTYCEQKTVLTLAPIPGCGQRTRAIYCQRSPTGQGYRESKVAAGKCRFRIRKCLKSHPALLIRGWPVESRVLERQPIDGSYIFFPSSLSNRTTWFFHIAKLDSELESFFHIYLRSGMFAKFVPALTLRGEGGVPRRNGPTPTNVSARFGRIFEFRR